MNAVPLCLGNISNDFSADNVKKTGLHGYVFDLSVDYDSVDVDDILDNLMLMIFWIFWYKIIFWFIKKEKIIRLLYVCTIASGSLVSNSQEPITCLSLTNRPCQVRPTLVCISSTKIFFIHFLSVLICVYYSYDWVRVANKVKNMNCNVRGTWNKGFSSAWIVWV